MKRILYLTAILTAMVSCEKKDESQPDPYKDYDVIYISDGLATYETKSLFSNLWTIQKTGFMFGHHDDLMYGRHWYLEEGRSDTKEVCGDYPAVFSVDLASAVDDRHEVEAVYNAVLLSRIKDAYDRGMVIVCSMNLNNPLTKGPSSDTTDVVPFILDKSSEVNATYKEWLNRLASVFSSLKGSDGKSIPVVFRPYHEHNQASTWWGKNSCSSSNYADLWKYTWKYMLDMGVHNVIYAICPRMDAVQSEQDFLFRWPGDEYVDFIAMDCYNGYDHSILQNNLTVLSQLSVSRKKPVGVTETGVEGFDREDYWTTNILRPVTGKKCSMLVTWRNKYVTEESDTEFFSVFPGHVSASDFVKMYRENNAFFCSDIPDMYEMADSVWVKSRD